MKKFIKKTISIFLATCTALPGSLCYAGNPKKHKMHHRSKRRTAAAAAASLPASTVEIEEKKLQALHAEINSLVGVTPTRKSFKLSESLKSQCIEIENIEHLQTLFTEVFVNFIETKKSADSIHQSTILFLSIVKLFERRSIPPSNQNFCWLLAFLSLNMCTVHDESKYDTWYDQLLNSHKPTALGNIKKTFNRQGWHDNLTRAMSDKYAVIYVKNDMINLLRLTGSDLAAPLVAMIYKQLHPFIQAYNQAEKIARTLLIVQSQDTISDAKSALDQLRAEHESFKKRKIPQEIPDRIISAAETVAKELDDIIKSTKPQLTSAHYFLNLYNPTNEKILKMLSEISPTSVTDAEKSCEPLFNFMEVDSNNTIISTVQATLSPLISSFNIALKWAKDYLNFIKPRKDESDTCIQILSEKFSDKTLEAAKRAQENYNKILSDYRPNDAYTYLEQGESGLVNAYGYDKTRAKQETQDTIEGRIVTIFEDEEKHWRENENKISKICEEQEAKAHAEELKRKQEQESAEWKNAVAISAADKEEQKNQERRRIAETCSASESSAPSEVVFLCKPDILNPLEFLDNNPQYKGVWNSWYDQVMRGETPSDAKSMGWKPEAPIYDSEFDLKACMKDGHPEIFKYKGGKNIRNTTEGLRIVYYMERNTKRIVVLYVGAPFGAKEISKHLKNGHGNQWKTLRIDSSWLYKPVKKF